MPRDPRVRPLGITNIIVPSEADTENIQNQDARALVKNYASVTRLLILSACHNFCAKRLRARTILQKISVTYG
jgi:hypothetical protein